MANGKAETFAPKIFVIGTASQDRLHLADQQVHNTIGGAGMYTALAASSAGAAVTLFAPRPDPLPAIFAPLAARINWIGPRIGINELPRLEIAHYGGGRAELLDASWGAEAKLQPERLPDDLSGYAIIHIAALSSAQRQLDFLRACRERNARKVSVGTYARIIQTEAATVQDLFQESDLFFMNENEAKMLFGSTESLGTKAASLLFVTRGEGDALAIEGENVWRIPSGDAEEVDPTGAGDSFCGAALTRLAQSDSAIEAAKSGHLMAAKSIQQIGPLGLY